MSPRALLAALGLSSFVATAAACAPASAPSREAEPSADQEVDTLGTSQRSYVVLRRDTRKCAYPMCSGWFVRDVNRKQAREAYVAALDFASSALDEATQEIVRGAPDGEVVLFGKLGDLPDWEDPAMMTFRVERAWRGMPGDVVDAADVYYATSAIEPAVQCLVAPCPAVHVKPLHKTQVEAIERVDLAGLGEPLVDRRWLGDRALFGGALVAGAIVDGEVFQGGPERVLDASQVFIELPEVQPDCPQARPACPEDESAIYQRDTDRCVVLSGCVEPGACAAYVPACGEGYTLQSWTGGMFACTVYACDPSFVVPGDEALAD